MSKDLSKDAVKQLVYSYKDQGVTNELYGLGMMLLSEIQQRAAQLDSKSTMALGWATSILAFVFVVTNKITTVIPARFAATSGAFALLAAIFSFSALRTRDDWGWFSDESWLCCTALVSEDELKRYHIRVIHDIRQTHLAATRKKAHRLLFAEIFLGIAAIFLFLGGIHGVTF